MDKKFKTVMVSVVLFIIAFAIIFITVRRQQPNPKPVLPVDHLWMDFIYPPGYCSKPSIPCLNPERAKTPLFTIHGLWPVDVNGRNVPGDHNARDADINDIKSNPSLRDEMEVYWPSMNGFNLEGNFEFWSKEWKTHGSADPTNNNDAILYFTKTMAVRKLPGGNISASLEKENINPGSFYDKEVYRTAMESINKQLGSIVLICYKDKKNIFHLTDVRVCVNQQGTSFIACNENEMKAEISCGTEKIMFDL